MSTYLGHDLPQSSGLDLQRRPTTANATGHVRQIEDEETMRVAGSASQTHTLSAATTGDIRRIDADVDTVRGRVDQTLTLSRALIDVVDIAVGGITALTITTHVKD